MKNKPKHKALSKVTGVSSPRQLYRESIPHLQKMAAEEKKKREPYEKKFGTFEERLEKFAKWKKSL